MAVAGLSEEDLEVELKETVLEIRSKQSTEDEANYVHRGIAKRSFQRSFTLSDDIVVKGCGLVNGMLTVELENGCFFNKTHITPLKYEPNNPFRSRFLPE